MSNERLGIVERRQARARRLVQLDIWTAAVKDRLAAGPALTSELAAAAGVKPGRGYTSFRNRVARLYRDDVIERHGERISPSGHINVVWALPGKAA